MNPPSIVLGGVHGKVCRLIAYMYLCYNLAFITLKMHVVSLQCGYHVTMLCYNAYAADKFIQ